MLNELLRTQNEIFFSEKYDYLKLKKENNQILIEKIKTGKNGWIYFLSFFLFGAAIIFFSHQWLVWILAGTVLFSTYFVIFLGYSSLIDLNSQTILLKKSLLGISLQKNISFYHVLDFKIKEGEIGHNLRVQLGENLGFINRIKSQWTLCRVSKYEECVDLLNWLREIIKPK